MRVLDTVSEFTRAMDDARLQGGTVGLVPTMGALHAGHRSLIERALAECDHVAVSIFVNPLQFGDAEDIERYPRTLDSDLDLCRSLGVGTVLAPGVADMYPAWPAPQATVVSVRGVSDHWEGRSRPGHFDGVCTVVAKLFSMTGPCRAYFGEKDFQQLAVVRRMVADLSMPVEVVGCPTVREQDGLALSSRNVRLSGTDRASATVLSRALATGRAAVMAGELSPSAVGSEMERIVRGEPAVALDYAAAVDAETLLVPSALDRPEAVRLVIAAQVGPVRLIDNCDAPVPAPTRGGRPARAAQPAPPARSAQADMIPAGSGHQLQSLSKG